jgi:predicted metal-dependent peptidase
VYLEDFPDLKMKARESRYYYYDILKKEKEKCQKNQKNGQGDPKNGSTNPSQDNLMDLLDNGMAGPNGPFGHPLWKEFEGLSEAEKKLMKNQIDYQLKEVAEQVTKSRGLVPGSIKQYLDGLEEEEEAKFDWRSYIRRFAGGSIKTYVRKSRRKPNIRFSELPGLKIKQRKHIFLAVDTSGSVSNEELRIFFNEIDHIQRTGTQVTLCQCDAAISDISEYKSGMKIKNREKKVAIYGRGGTDFQPPIDYYNENHKKFSCMIYFTDGECSPPENSPKDKLLWVMNGKDNAELPGYRIVFEN